MVAGTVGNIHYTKITPDSYIVHIYCSLSPVYNTPLMGIILRVHTICTRSRYSFCSGTLLPYSSFCSGTLPPYSSFCSGTLLPILSNLHCAPAAVTVVRRSGRQCAGVGEGGWSVPTNKSRVGVVVVLVVVG